MRRSKPYTKGGGNPYTERYMEAFKTLHETERKPCTERYMEAFKTLHETERKPCTKRSANPARNGAQTLHCNGALFT